MLPAYLLIIPQNLDFPNNDEYNSTPPTLSLARIDTPVKNPLSILHLVRNDFSDSQQSHHLFPNKSMRCAATSDSSSDDNPQHSTQEDRSNFIEPQPIVYEDYDSSDDIP